MKIITNYEFKAKINAVEKLPAGFDMTEFESKKAEAEAHLDEVIKELLAEYLYSEDEVEVERIKLNIEVVDD